MDKPQTEGSLVKRSSRWKLILAALIAAFILTVIVALNVGYAPISFSQILLILGKQIPFAPISSASISPKNSAIILRLRLPRVLAGALVGAGLAAAGVIYQGIFRNPMADSYLLGASAGASVGYTIAVLYVTSSLSFNRVGDGTGFRVHICVINRFRRADYFAGRRENSDDHFVAFRYSCKHFPFSD